MRQKDLGIWRSYTWQDSYEQVRQLSLGLIELGLKRGDKVCIIGDNDPIHRQLFDVHRIEVPVIPWPKAPSRLLRISAQLYNTADDYARLTEALKSVLKS